MSIIVQLILFLLSTVLFLFFAALLLGAVMFVSNLIVLWVILAIVLVSLYGGLLCAIVDADYVII